jgi:hypothetical protein
MRLPAQTFLCAFFRSLRDGLSWYRGFNALIQRGKKRTEDALVEFVQDSGPLVGQAVPLAHTRRLSECITIEP